MAIALKLGAANQIPKGTVIFSENEPLSYVCVIVKGKISSVSDKLRFSLVGGGFVGVCDLFVGHYLANYITEEDSIIYAFPAKNTKEALSFLESGNKDYRGLMVNSLNRQLITLLQINREYKAMADQLFKMLSEGYQTYKNLAKNGGVAATVIGALEQTHAYVPEESVGKTGGLDLAYFEELIKVPVDVQKGFFGAGTGIATAHIKELAGYIVQNHLEANELGEYLNEYLPYLYNDGEKSLLYAFMQLTAALSKSGRGGKEYLAIVDKLADSYRQMETKLCQFMGTPVTADKGRLEQLQSALTAGNDLSGLSTNTTNREDLYRELNNSLKQIIEYSRLEEAEYAAFVNYVNKFATMSDRLSTEDDARILRKKIAEEFYKIYHAVFKRYLANSASVPMAVRLFLNYGFADERLLTKEQAVELCELDVSTKQTYHCTVFTIPEWLRAVYFGERQPSKNEFDLEYNEMLRELKKNGEIDEEEEKKRQQDAELKLTYEIQNLFRYNHRIINGQPSVFVPVLCSEQIMTNPLRAAVTKDRIGQTIERYREIDYSVFYRELSYASKEAGIEKEFEMREVVPDVILFPSYGQASIMWQELSAKRRDSAARFLFPIFVEGNLDDLVVRTFGRFRWELCRTMQGTAWNNIQYKSLTSEYSDYIQFYRKNRDLSEERKEKVKQQIAKGKNNTREIFVIDYEQWIKAESAGGVRLNRIAREILAMYCPFHVSIRKALEGQPAYADAIGRFNRETQKKIREIELRHHAITKQGIELTKELLHTLSFYKDM